MGQEQAQLMIGTNFGLFLIEHVRRRHTGHIRGAESDSGEEEPPQSLLLLLLLAEVSTFMVIMACQRGRGVVHYRRAGRVCRESVEAALISLGIYEIPHVFDGLVGNLLSMEQQQWMELLPGIGIVTPAAAAAAPQTCLLLRRCLCD